ncbi:MAG: hypothetical protein ACI855_004092 [Myxococcota bacterium]|jgi:hypothetical protein
MSRLATTAIALAGLAVPWQGVQHAAWAGVEEGVGGRGWAAGIDRGMLVLEGKLQSLPEETVRSMLEEVASQLGQSALSDPDNPSARQLTGLSPEEAASRKTLAEMIKAKLAGVKGKVFEKGYETLITEGTHLALDELMDAARTGQHSLTDDEVMGVFGTSLKKMAGTAASETGKAVGGGARAFAGQQRQAAARGLMDSSETHSTADRAFLDWVSSNDVPLGSADELGKARARFDSSVWDVAVGQVETQRPDDDSIDFAAYETWVFADPTKVQQRASTTNFADFQERYAKVRQDLADQQNSSGYQQLDDDEQRWFQEASKRRWLPANLGTANPEVVFSIDSDAGRRRFRQGIAGAQDTLAGSWVDRWAADVGGRRGAFAKEHMDYIIGGLSAVPGDDLRGYEVISQRVHEAQRMMSMAEQAGLHADDGPQAQP